MLTPIPDHQPAAEHLEGLVNGLRKALKEAPWGSHAAKNARLALDSLERDTGLTTAQRLQTVRDIAQSYRANKLLDFSHHHPGDRPPHQ